MNALQRGVLRQVPRFSYGVGHLVVPCGPRNFASSLAEKTTTYDWIIKTKVSCMKPDLLDRIRKLFGILPAEQHKFAATGTFMYKTMVEHVNYTEFYEILDMPHEFASWFKVTELHVWLLMVRAMGEGANGPHLRNQIVRALWDDVAEQFGNERKMNPNWFRRTMKGLHDHLIEGTVLYDHALLCGDDKMLANVIWEHFFDSNCDDIVKVELLVKYVREMVCLLDGINKASSMCIKPSKEWLIPFGKLKVID